MKEQLISFAVAKLSKEKGFTVPDTAFDYYRTKTKIGRCHRESQTGQYCLYHKCDFCIVVTQSLLQRWLREEHERFVTIVPVVYAAKLVWTSYSEKRNKNIRHWETYEEALEAELQKTLKLLNKQ